MTSFMAITTEFMHCLSQNFTQTLDVSCRVTGRWRQTTEAVILVSLRQSENDKAHMLHCYFVTQSTAAPRQWDHTHCTTPYNWAPSLDNDLSQVDLSHPTWMSPQAEWMKQQSFDGEKERTHCGHVTQAFVIPCTEVNTAIVGQARACLSLSLARWQLGCVWLPYPPDRGQRRGRRMQSLSGN